MLCAHKFPEINKPKNAVPRQWRTRLRAGAKNSLTVGVMARAQLCVQPPEFSTGFLSREGFHLAVGGFVSIIAACSTSN
jgi:hypothetical protein